MDTTAKNSPEPPVDIGELQEIMDHDEELLKECLDDFMNDYPEMVAQKIGRAHV
jgi:hypothetical protein